MSNLVSRDLKHFSKEIVDSSLLAHVFALQNLSSLEGVLDKLSQFYTVSLNDEDVESVSLEA